MTVSARACLRGTNDSKNSKLTRKKTAIAWFLVDTRKILNSDDGKLCTRVVYFVDFSRAFDMGDALVAFATVAYLYLLPLGKRVESQRKQYRQYTESKQTGLPSGCAMNEDRVALLEGLGFVWSVRKGARKSDPNYNAPSLSWDDRLEQLKACELTLLVSVLGEYYTLPLAIVSLLCCCTVTRFLYCRQEDTRRLLGPVSLRTRSLVGSLGG